MFQNFTLILLIQLVPRFCSALFCEVGSSVEKCDRSDWFSSGDPTCFKFEYWAGGNKFVTRGCDRTGATCKFVYGLANQNSCATGTIKNKLGATACCCNDRNLCNHANSDRYSFFVLFWTSIFMIVFLNKWKHV